MENILGFRGTKEEVLKIWAENAERWFSVGSPWRPSPGDIMIYQHLAGKNISGNVLILGATPELRDLASRYSSLVVLIDISCAMIERTTTLLKEADPRNEIWIRADWCEAPLPPHYFDLIMSDMPWWVLSVPKQAELRDKVATLLKPDGLLVTRIRLRDPERITQNAAAVIQNYLEKLSKNPDAEEKIRNALVSHLHDITADTANLRIDRAKTKKTLLDAAERQTNSAHRDFLREASEHLLSADWTSQTREEIMAIIGERFSPVTELNATDYDSEWYPIIAFKKNA